MHCCTLSMALHLNKSSVLQYMMVPSFRTANYIIIVIISETIIEGPRTRVGQPKMKCWKWHELHKNEVKKIMCLPYEHMPKNLEILNFEQLLKHILRVFLSLGGGGGGGGKFNSVGLDHSGSQPFQNWALLKV